MSNDEQNTRTPADSSPALRSGDGFGWFHRRDAGRPDHVISLCAGHKYLTEKGRWQSGPGDMPTLPPPSGCCVCNGFVTVARMKNAPLKPNAKALAREALPAADGSLSEHKPNE